MTAISSKKAIFDFLKNASRDDLIGLIKQNGTPTEASRALGVDHKVFLRYAEKNRIKTKRQSTENKGYTVYCKSQYCMNRPASSTGVCFECYARQARGESCN